MSKRKVRIHGKIDLMETSAVGLPAYPYAHASANLDSFSLVKAISNASLRGNTGFVEEGGDINAAGVPAEQLNLEEKEAMVESEESAPVTPEVPETKAEETPAVPEAKAEVPSEIAKAIADGIKAGFKELELNRGVVDKQVPVKKSLGEIAMGMHNDAYGLKR